MPVETIDVPTADGVADAYLARPDGDGPHPGVLLAMDAIGLRPRIAEMAERIAAEGYVVLAPNLFYRAGRAPVLPLPDFSDPDSRAEFMAAVKPIGAQLDPAAMASDGQAYLDFLAGHAPGPVGITGYCMGARFALLIAADYGERVAAVGGWHGGGLVRDDESSPHLRAADIRAEVVLGHAKDDAGLTAEQARTLHDALTEAGVTVTDDIYDGHHGYTMADTAVYDEAATERHWRELFALLERTL